MRIPSRTFIGLCLVGVMLAPACNDDATGSLAQDDAADGVTLTGPDASGTSASDSIAVTQSDTDPGTAPETTAPETTLPEETTTATVAADTTAEDTAPADTMPAEDTAPTTAADTVTADTVTADTTPSDTVTADTTLDTETSVPACSDSCPELGAGPTPVTVTLKGTNAQAPSLTGLPAGVALPADRFGFTAIDIYQYQTFSGISVSITNLGGTNGVVALEGDLWAFRVELDLSLTADTFIGPLSGEAHNTVVGGGCFEVQGHFLQGDLTQCADGWPDTVAPPDQVEFQYDPTHAQLKIKLVLDKDFVIALLPEQYQALAGGFITGPLKLVGTLAPIN